MSSEEKDFGTIVELLKKDYLLKTENNLKQKIGEIIQDFISRGLYNSNACTGSQLQAHFDHIDKLIDHILESLEQDFPDIPLEQVKEQLFTTVDEEYKKLVPLANSHLVSAGLAQQSNLESFKQLINGKKEKTKQAIETKLAILEKKKATPPPGSIFGDIWTIWGIPINVKEVYTKLKSHPFLLVCCLLAIALIAAHPLWWPLVNKIDHDSSGKSISSKAKTSGNSSPAINTSGPNSPVTVNYDSPKSKTEQSIELIPNISQQGLDKKLTEIRLSKRLRKLIPLETGRSISETPAGTYFFVWPGYLRFTDGNVEYVLKNSCVSSYTRERSDFEMHKISEYQVFLLGYVGNETGAALSNAAKSNRKEITLFSSPLENFQNLAMIPINRIFKSNDREISSPETGDIEVLDMLIE